MYDNLFYRPGAMVLAISMGACTTPTESYAKAVSQGECPCMRDKRADAPINDSTSPAIDQSGPGPSKSGPIRSENCLGRARTNLQFFGTWTEQAWTAVDRSIQAESARIRCKLLIYVVTTYTHLVTCNSPCTSYPSPPATYHSPVTTVIF